MLLIYVITYFSSIFQAQCKALLLFKALFSLLQGIWTKHSSVSWEFPIKSTFSEFLLLFWGLWWNVREKYCRSYKQKLNTYFKFLNVTLFFWFSVINIFVDLTDHCDFKIFNYLNKACEEYKLDQLTIIPFSGWEKRQKGNSPNFCHWFEPVQKVRLFFLDHTYLEYYNGPRIIMGLFFK